MKSTCTVCNGVGTGLVGAQHSCAASISHSTPSVCSAPSNVGSVIFSVVIWVVTIALFVYARAMARRGVLR